MCLHSAEEGGTKTQRACTESLVTSENITSQSPRLPGPGKAMCFRTMTASCMPGETALSSRCLGTGRSPHIAIPRHTCHFPVLLSLPTLLTRANKLFCLFFFLLFVSSRSPAVPRYCSHTTNCLSFCDMTSKAAQSLQDNRDPSCENQLRIFMHSACDLQFSFISSFSSEHLHHNLLHLLSPTPFSSLAVTSTFCPRTFLKEKATRTPFFSQQPPLRIAGYCFSSACLLQTSSPPTSFW